MVSKEFFEALADLEAEKGISEEVFIDALRNALISAYKKQYEGGAGDVGRHLARPPQNLTGSLSFFSLSWANVAGCSEKSYYL